MLVDPIYPTAINVHLADRVVGEMTTNRVRKKLYGNAVVLQGMVELIGLRDGDAEITSVTHD